MKTIIKKINSLSKKILLLTACGMLSCCGTHKNLNTGAALIGMDNPWIDCGTDLNLAAQKAGFTFPLSLSNYTVRAMNDMIEVTYPLDKHRKVSVRKSETESNGGNISGDYTNYPITDEVLIKSCVPIKLKRDQDKIYIMYFGAESGYFSARCPQGINLQEVEKIYETIAAAETSSLWQEN